MTSDEEGCCYTGLNRNQVVDLVSERKEFIFNMFVNSKPV